MKLNPDTKNDSISVEKKDWEIRLGAPCKRIANAREIATQAKSMSRTSLDEKRMNHSGKWSIKPLILPFAWRIICDKTGIDLKMRTDD